MALVDSLLTAIVRADGDALVMHVGEKPYVVASAAPVELSTQGLNLEAMVGMVAQLLPADMQRALTEFGAVEHQLPPTAAMAGDRFTVVAARGGDDVWIEIRRHRQLSMPAFPADAAEGTAPVGSAAVRSHDVSRDSQAQPLVAGEAARAESVSAVPPAVAGESIVRADPLTATPSEAVAVDEKTAAAAGFAGQNPVAHSRAAETLCADAEPSAFANAVPSAEPLPAAQTVEPAASAERTALSEPASTSQAGEPEGPSVVPTAVDATPATAPTQSTSAEVVQMTRTVRIDISPKQSLRSGPSPIERLLGIAAARGAAALYLTAQTPPALRVDDEVRLVDGEAALTSADIEAGVAEVMPEPMRGSLQRGEPAEWVADLPNVGRVRFSTFRDHRGSGAVLQLVAVPTAEQLGFSTDIQALATETEGLVLVAAPRGAGKSTMLAAFVDLMNRQRSYVITLERQIRFVHDNRDALISQREVPGTADQVLRVTRGALRENPDVLVIDDVGSSESLQLALQAAGSGLLVLIAITAASTTAALNHLIDLFPADRRQEAQLLIAERLRGAVAQALLRKTGGGRVVARELLLATASVTRMLAEGHLSELPSAIESGRKHGMASLTESLVGLIRNGVVDVREAYRKADDRDALLRALKRENIDTTPVERLA